MDKIKERGEASIIISLSEGIIKVAHGTDKVVLEEWEAKQGDWDKLWDTINTLAKAEK